jgi:hypothetical protein
VAHWAVPRFPVRIWLPNWGLITEFSMKYAFSGCVWNVRVDWANYNESVLWKNVNLCRFNVLRLRPGTKTTSFVAE